MNDKKVCDLAELLKLIIDRQNGIIECIGMMNNRFDDQIEVNRLIKETFQKMIK